MALFHLSVILWVLATQWSLADSPGALHSYLEKAESAGIIDEEQSLQLRQLALTMNLKVSAPGDTAEETTPSTLDDTEDDPSNTTEWQQRANVFTRIYNHLTLLNMLYLSGAVVVMGAYTIFMTLAVEKCSHASLAGVMVVQVVLFGVAGVSLWYTINYAYVGGL